MIRIFGRQLLSLIFMLTLATILSTTSGCSRELTECNGPELDKDELLGLRQTLFTSGPRAFLVVPNPIDATNSISIEANDSRLDKVVDGFFLPDLLSPSRLETDFLKVRINSINDDLSILAQPNAQGNFDFAIDDVHYSEVMAYHSLSAMMRYVETLGFGLVKSRPLYVMVRAKEEDGSEPQSVNAIYTHNYLNPSKPRTLHLFGNTPYAPGMDRDIYWHEFGHYLNESVSRETGIDFAGDSGAIFTEGAAIHECLADYLSESVGNKGYIGRWIARNFSNVKAGDPLRSAEGKPDDMNDFHSVSTFSVDGKNLDRYRMAEWCSRVLWDIRSQFAKEDGTTGSLFADRLMFSAVSLLKKDSSVSEFRSALVKADKSLHCGLHRRSIEKAFEVRGFSQSGSLSAPLTLKAAPIKLSAEEAGLQQGSGFFSFAVTISNPNGEKARNVRLILETVDGKFSPTTYLQGYGDLAAGGVIRIGTQDGLDSVYSVMGIAPRGASVRYRLRVRIENGPESILEGKLDL
jgi:hypothetical protein